MDSEQLEGVVPISNEGLLQNDQQQQKNQLSRQHQKLLCKRRRRRFGCVVLMILVLLFVSVQVQFWRVRQSLDDISATLSFNGNGDGCDTDEGTMASLLRDMAVQLRDLRNEIQQLKQTVTVLKGVVPTPPTTPITPPPAFDPEIDPYPLYFLDGQVLISPADGVKAPGTLLNFTTVGPDGKMSWVGERQANSQHCLQGFEMQVVDEKHVPVKYLTIQYMAHLGYEGDSATVEQGSWVQINLNSNFGANHNVQGVAFWLEGDLAAHYNINYQLSIRNYNFPGPIVDTAVCSNGEFCGTRGESRSAQALQVWITLK